MTEELNPITRIGLTREVVCKLGPEKALELARTMARFETGVFHPDRFGDIEAFRTVQDAWRELDDPNEAMFWARSLMQGPHISYQRTLDEAREKAYQAQRTLDASIHRFMEFVCLDRSSMTGTVTVIDGGSRRTLTVEGGEIVPPPALAGHRVLSARVIGTITSPPGPYAEDLAGGRVSFPLRAGQLPSPLNVDSGRRVSLPVEAGESYDPGLAVLGHLDCCIRPYDPSRDITLVSLYTIEPESLRCRFEGTVVEWTGKPLPPDDTLPAEPRMTGPELIEKVATHKWLFDLVDGSIRREFRHLPRHHQDDFLSFAWERLLRSKLQKYDPERSLPAYLHGFAKNQRLHFFRDVVAKNFRTRDPVLLEAVLDRGLGPLDTALREEVRDEVRQGIAQLGTTLCAAAKKRFLEGKKCGEIAAELGLTFSEAKNRVDYAREKLRKLLRPLQPG
jgi:RNA polymerase sigma factor (sigma-70 family)